MPQSFIDRCLNKREAQHFATVYAAAKKAFSNGRVTIALVTTIRSSFNRVISQVWKKTIEEPYLRYTANLTNEERGFLFGVRRPDISNFTSIRQQIRSIPIDHIVKDKMLETMDGLEPIVLMVNQLARIAVPKSSSLEKSARPQRLSASMQRIQNVIEGISIDAGPRLQQQIEARLNGELERFQTKAVSVEKYFAERRLIDPIIREFITACDNDPDWPKLVREKASDLALSVRFEFNKVEKLVAIIDTKGNMNGVEVLHIETQLGGLLARLQISFRDKSSFVAQNSATWFQSRYGKLFLRRHLTFHDVVMPNGIRLRRPSEARMLKEFVGQLTAEE